MKRASLVAGAAMVSTVLFAGPVWAQGAPQTVRIERVDVQKLAAGYRSSKIVGSPVVNDANEKIGDVDDLLVEPSDKVLFAVLSVGGFLGMGEHLVVVPFSSLQIAGNKVMLPGGTKDALNALPEFKYATK
ncbi:MAG TPA: PRC-barrel domain-containing protein [Casimicrobiaceae bacterium]|nr:PRC-barrel domain-containing protein [Casimicrobiaceae bacterium]